MPRSKQATPAAKAATPAPKGSIPPSKTSHLFGDRKSGERGGAMTSERIASDLENFRKSGGRIEVLGITQSLKKIGEAPTEGGKAA